MKRLRDARLTAVNFVADAVNRAIDLKEIADNALHAVLAVMKLDAGVVYVWQDSAQALSLFARRGISESFARQVENLPKGTDPTIDAVLDGATRVIEDFQPQQPASHGDAARAGFAVSVLSPIRAQGFVVGLLLVGAYRPRTFSHDDTELIEAITHQIGNAMVHAQLLDDLRRKNDLLELLVEEAHHRIKNNLQMVSGLLQLQAETAGEDVAGHLRSANTRIQAIAKVHNLLSQEMPEQVDVQVLITAIVNTLVDSAQAAGGKPTVSLELENLRIGSEQAVALALIVNELVSNSLLHGRPPAGAPLQVTVGCHRDGTQARVSVHDNGGGLVAHKKRRPGQGMNIVQQLARVNLRGRLEIANRDGGVSSELEFEVIKRSATAGA